MTPHMGLWFYPVGVHWTLYTLCLGTHLRDVQRCQGRPKFGLLMNAQSGDGISCAC